MMVLELKALCEHVEQPGAQNAALGFSTVKDEGGGGVSTHPHHLPVGKSRIHMCSEVLNLRSSSFATSLKGTVVLNAELQSMNSDLIKLPFLSG